MGFSQHIYAIIISSFPVICFLAVQETSRSFRCKDSPINSGIAGAATGALLFASHGAAPPRGAVLCGAIGAAAHWTVDKISLEKNFRSFLISWGLLDEIASRRDHHKLENNSTGGIEQVEEEEEGLWARMRPYFPVRKLTETEWEEHQKKKNAAEEKARRAALQGVSDAALEELDTNEKET